MSKKSNTTNQTGKQTSASKNVSYGKNSGNKNGKNVKNVSYSKNGKGGTAVKKKQDRASWIIAGVIIAVALIGIILLAVFAGGGSTSKVNGQQGSPSRQQQTIPDCCE